MRIIVADDHPLVQEALAGVLVQSFPEARIRACLSLAEVTAALGGSEPADLVLLDLNMPDSGGFAGLFQLLAEHPTVPVAILSAVEDPATIRRALGYGASGYIPKSTPVARMAEAVRAILAGEIWAPADVAGGEGEAGKDEADWARRFASLSPQQIRILLMVRAGRLNKQIAAELGIAEQTVKVHVSTILKKLQVGSRTQAAVAADRLAVSGVPTP